MTRGPARFAVPALALLALLTGCASRHARGGPITDASDDFPYADGLSYNFATDSGSASADDVVGDSPLGYVPGFGLQFGYVGCGSPASTQTFPVLNNGSGTLVASAMTTGPGFSVTPNSMKIEAGGMGTFALSATIPASATAGVPITGSLVVTTNDPGQAYTSVPLTVTPTGANFQFSSGSNTLAFPESEIGEQVTQNLTLTNTGNAPATITVGAPSDPHFSLPTDADAGGPDGGAPDGGTVATVKPGDKWTAKVNFRTRETTPVTATSTVTISGVTCGSNPSTISFSGQGGYGQVTGWPTAPIDFGPAPCGGGPPDPQFLTLTNPSPVDVVVQLVYLDQPGFAVDLRPGTRIYGNGGALAVEIKAPAVPTASSLTPITATLYIQTDADSAPHLVTLQEEPQGAVLAFDTSTTPNFGSFGQVNLLLSATQGFAVTNKGTGPATVTLSTASQPAGDAGTQPTGDAGLQSSDDASADVTLMDAADATLDGGSDAPQAPPPTFAISNPSFSLGSNGTQTDTVTFMPRAGTNYVDQITMQATGAICSTIPAPLPLSGIGFGGGLSITPSLVAFTPTCGGRVPDPWIVTLTNSGSADLTWSLGPVTGPGAAQYTVTALRPPGLLGPREQAQIRVTTLAIPSPAPNPDPSALSAQFTVTTDVPFDDPHVIPLSETPLGDRLSFSVQEVRFGQFPVDHVAPTQTVTVTNAANPGSPATSFDLVFTAGGDAGAVTVLPEDGGSVCILADGGGDSAVYCPVPDAGDGGDASDAGDAGDAADGGVGPEQVVAGYILAPTSVDSLGPGASVAASVTFIPTAPVNYPATIGIRPHGGNYCSARPVPIPLTGAGTQGEVAVSATSIAFGTDPQDPKGLVNCGAIGLAHTLHVGNVGSQSFNITGLSLAAGTTSPYSLSGPGATLPATVPIGHSVDIIVTPSAIPGTVANPNDPLAFADTLTVTTDAVLDTPHTVSLVMQPRGAVIADRPLSTSWTFGTITLGSIGTYASSIQNTGNGPAQVTLQGLAHPATFGLENNPTIVAPNGATAFYGQFAPAVANQNYTDQGTLVVTTSQAFCQPLPAHWTNAVISMSGSATANAPIAIDGSLAFPASDCGSAPPAGQSVVLTNNTNQGYGYSLSFATGAFYTIADPGPGTIGANSTATVVVTPKTIAPGQGVQAGSAPYTDTLLVNTFPLSVGDAASGPTAPSFAVAVSWALNGAVLSLPQGAGPATDGQGHTFYRADTASGFPLPVNNTGTKDVTVTLAGQPANVVTWSPAALVVPANGGASLHLSSTGSDAACPARTPAQLTFFYSGAVCQPLQLPSVSVSACTGTF